MVQATVPNEPFGPNATPEHMVETAMASAKDLSQPTKLVISYEEYKHVLFILGEDLVAERMPPYPGLKTHVFHYGPIPVAITTPDGYEVPSKEHMMTTVFQDGGDIAIVDIRKSLIPYMYERLQKVHANIMQGPN